MTPAFWDNEPNGPDNTQSMIPELDYAPYVWGSYGAFAVILAWQIIQPVLRRRRVQAQLREQLAERAGSYGEGAGAEP